MGEENTWFDLLPGVHQLTLWARHYLGREQPGEAFYFRGGPFTDSHFGLTHVLATILVAIFIIAGALAFHAAMRRGGDQAIVPPANMTLRNLFEMLGDAIWNMSCGIMGEQSARRYLPLIGTLAFFILFNNLLALIPGFAPPTATLKTNIALALTVFVITHVEGVRAQGVGNYIKHFLGPLWWLAWLILPIEIIGHLARPVSLSLRLMGNMTADHKVVGVFFFLVPLLVPVPFLLLGTLVAVVQTLVFCLLSMVYISQAVAVHHEDHGDHADHHAHGEAAAAHSH